MFLQNFSMLFNDVMLFIYEFFTSFAMGKLNNMEKFLQTEPNPIKYYICLDVLKKQNKTNCITIYIASLLRKSLFIFTFEVDT